MKRYYGNPYGQGNMLPED